MERLGFRTEVAKRREATGAKRIITSAIEHHAVLTTAEDLRDHFGFDLTILPVNSDGVVQMEDVVTALGDGKDVAVPKGTNAIEAARLVGVDVPYYCYHPKLSVVGNCRMCLIEMGMPAVDPATKAPIMDPATGKQKINWIPRPQIGCATNAAPGLHIRTNTPQIKDCREGVMEFLLVNHPLDCPICDQAGECKLQEQSTGYGRGYSRYIEQKNVKPKRTQLGPRVTLDDERCILCSRCIRFCKEVAKDDVLGFISLLTRLPIRRRGRLAQAAAEGHMGVTKSIVGRMESLGGSAELTTSPGAGTEWELTLPRTGGTDV